MFASSGEITAPCGVPSSDARHSPSSDARHSPSSEVPAVSHFRMSLITLWSPILCSMNLISHSWLTLSKN
ncbi:Uncharacterised protein [Klebsiella pneumoniae]|nr:Uncharacterised protein [Klebsiella pneumoniae]VGP64591.1 hypothetical protein SB02110_05572 [Klebsiella quasipneumoniae subsp. quasipneumoniae]SBN34346.1 hypothetical protein KPMX200_60003 [Klebsiella pneumoniae]SBZ48361.1 Uncharacterised protein [Klebsiella pneumoniae]SLS03387.1 Uncharacterised protein [Klebsiella pneumoniae]